MPDDAPPRKVTLGTCWMLTEKAYRGLDDRLERLADLVGRMAARALETTGRPLDIACLPEDANTAGWLGQLDDRAEDLPGSPDEAPGPTIARLADAAREHGCYVIIPHFVRTGGRTFNSAVLLGRDGAILGRYDKLHGVEEPDGSGRIELCCTPGTRVPVWGLDLGRVGCQICFDTYYDDGWQALEDRGAEIVFWPSAVPGVQLLRHRAWQHGYYVVASVWRPPCGIYDPTGHAVARATRDDAPVLVTQVDLEWRLMPWRSARDRGAALRRRYGDRIGMAHRPDEDVWLLWSNDPALPVDRVIQDEGLEELNPYLERMRRLQDDIRGGPPLV